MIINGFITGPNGIDQYRLFKIPNKIVSTTGLSESKNYQP